MRRWLNVCVFVLPLTLLGVTSLHAEVKTRERAHVKFEGMLGRMVNLFGGKAAKEGVVSTSAVKGDRKGTFTDTTGRIVDLKEEKIYELDLKKKTYQVTTFEEVRRKLREAQERAKRDAEKEGAAGKEPQEPSGKELEVEFALEETGQKKSLAGYDARQIIMTVTVREKGQALEEGGGLLMTTDTWMGPRVPAMKELADFEQRYWQAIAPETTALSAEQLAAVVAMYPMVKQAIERMNKENVNLEGTPLATTTTFEAVKSKAQMEQESQGNTGGGLGGMLARKVMKRDTKQRAVFMTATTEMLEIGTSVPPADLDIPAGFKQKS